MKCIAVLLAAQMLHGAAALTLAKRENPKVLVANIQRRHLKNPAAHDLLRRQDKTVQQSLDNLETLYFMNASLGTPPQKFRLHIDTGSSDLWVNAENASLCTSQNNICDVSGTYNPDKSSTYQFVNKDFNISYVDGSGAVGFYAKDVFHFGGHSIDDLQFGVGLQSSSPEGILGIGYTINEVQVNRFQDEPYPNLPQLLVDHGYINSNAYSLWLNDLDASTGNILFGGVDTAKFEGKLQTLPILPMPNGKYSEFIIALTGLGQNGDTTTVADQIDVPVLLDSGSSLMYLPDDITKSLYSAYNARYDGAAGAAYCDCNVANDPGSLDFSFSGVTIRVPTNELVITVGSRGSEPICILGIGPAGDSVPVLGDTFLRSAYVVYDLDNNEISMAQTRFNATESDVQEITKGRDAVPDAVPVQNPVTTAPVESGNGRNPHFTPLATTRGRAAGVPRPTADAWVAGAALAGMGMAVGWDGLGL